MKSKDQGKKVVALAGGVGGAKLADGLAQTLNPERLTVIVNTGDDFEHFNLHISPDLDTVCYTLAGKANPITGWGLAGESWNMLEGLGILGGPTWFRLGDRDLATHLERTRRLRQGQTLSQVTRDFCRAWGVTVRVLPMSDQPVRTIVLSAEHDALPFQDYFVRLQCRPRVRGFRFEGIETAQPAPGVLSALHEANCVILCPSNPWVSLDPILAVPGIREALLRRRETDRLPVIAVTPIIRGETIKGPAAKMYTELGIQPSALAVARHYCGLISAFVLDSQDEALQPEIAALGIDTLVEDTIMKTPHDRQRLARKILEFTGILP